MIKNARKYTNRIRLGALKTRKSLGGTIVEYVFIGIIFTSLTFIYSAGVILDGSHKLFIGGPGDGTAGMTWILHVQEGLHPIPTHTDMVNYPEGANLSSPLLAPSALLHAPAWALSRFMPTFMAINIMLYIAFVGVAMLSYWLLKQLTGKWYIAFFAGFILAFMPYHIFKSVSHIANIFSWVFVALIATNIYLWRSPSSKLAFLVALAVGAGYYTDGYYLLLSSVLAVTLAIGGIGAKILLKACDLKKYVYSLAMAAVFVLIFSMPLLTLQIIGGKQVSNDLSNARSDIKTEVSYYAAWGIDYITPPQGNPFFAEVPAYQRAQAKKNTRSNPPESALYLGITVIVLTIIGIALAIVFVLANKNSPVRSKLSNKEYETFIVLSSFIVVSVPIMLSFMGPLERNFYGLRVPMLSDILTNYVSLWRVLTRFILPLHALLGVYAAYTLYVLVRLIRGKTKIWVTVTVILVSIVAVEYATSANRPAFTLRNMPQTYWEIKKRDDIKVLAELPITDKPVEVNGFYATGQLIHGKKLINNHLIKYSDGKVSTLGDIQNTETLDYIRERGADHVILRGKSCQSFPWGKLEFEEKIKQDTIYTPPEYNGADYAYMCLYKIDAAATTDDLLLAIELSDFMNESGHTSGIYETYVRDPKVKLRIINMRGDQIKGRAEISMTVRSKRNIPYQWVIKQGGSIKARGNVEDTGVFQQIVAQVDSISSVELTFTPTPKGDGNYIEGDLVLNNYKATSQ